MGRYEGTNKICSKKESILLYYIYPQKQIMSKGINVRYKSGLVENFDLFYTKRSLCLLLRDYHIQVDENMIITDMEAYF